MVGKMDVKKEKYEEIYDKKFSFGKNWENFLKNLTKERIDISKKYLKEFIGLKNLKNKTFLDIGCGSGIQSLAACQLGAKVISVDIDDNCIDCTKYLRKVNNINEEDWKIIKGSILDDTLLNKLEKADIVYSWGVLHHTGDMWKALRNVMSLVKEKGLLYIAIYNKYEGLLSSEFWLRIKKIYANLNKFFRHIITFTYIFLLIILMILIGRNPVKYIKEYKKERGMSFYTDVVDWLGGYPYEFATPKEITKFCKRQGFKSIKLKEIKGWGCNQFLFKNSN